MPAEIPPPPPPPAEEPIVEIERELIISRVPDSTGNNFNNTALVGADRYMNNKMREVTTMLNKVNDLQEERLWNAYQANPTQVNADAYQNYVKEKNESIRKSNAIISEARKYKGMTPAEITIAKLRESNTSKYNKKKLTFTGDPKIDLEQFKDGN